MLRRSVLALFVSLSLLPAAAGRASANGDDFPHQDVADRFRERYSLPSDPQEVDLDKLLEERFLRVQVGLFTTYMSTLELEEKSAGDEFRDMALALVDAQARWLEWMKPVSGDTKATEKDLATLRTWIKSWRGGALSTVAKDGGADLLVALNPKEKTVEASERVATIFGSGATLGIEREEPRFERIVLVPSRKEFVEILCFVGWLFPDWRHHYWKADVANWTEFFVKDVKVLSLQYPTGGERYEQGSSMNEDSPTGMQQQITQLAMNSMFDNYLGHSVPPEFASGMALNMVIDVYGEARTRVDGSLKERQTSGYSVFVPGGQSEGGVLPGFSAETRWREDHGADRFVRVLRQSQQNGAGLAKDAKDKVSHFRLQDENRIKDTVVSGPFFGAAAADFQLPAKEFLDDYSEFMRSYRCGFVFWLRDESENKKKATKQFAQLLTDLAHAESLAEFEKTVTAVYELPVSEKEIGDKSLEGKFLKWLSKQ